MSIWVSPEIKLQLARRPPLAARATTGKGSAGGAEAGARERAAQRPRGVRDIR